MEQNIKYNSAPASRSGQVSLARMMEVLKIQGNDLDCTLICGDKKIKCNRAILEIASDVFLQMFTTDMSEARTGIVKMENVDGTMMQLVVDYYTTGALPPWTKFSHPALVSIIQKYMFDGINNAIADKVIKDAEFQPELYSLLFEHYGSASQKEEVVAQITRRIAEESGFAIGPLIDGIPFEYFNAILKASQERVSAVGRPQSEQTAANKRLLQLIGRWITKDPYGRMGDFLELFEHINYMKIDFDTIVSSVDAYPFRYMQMIRKTMRDMQVLCSSCEKILRCTRCRHPSNVPFHTSKECEGLQECCRLGFKIPYVRGMH